jgi:hypothetical protein
MTTRHVAQCACGAISATTEAEPRFSVQCHCTQCQRRTGSPFGVGVYFHKEDVRLAGTPKSYRRTVEGTERTLTNYFCPDCGSTVYWTLDLRPQHIGIALGSFADASFGAPARSVWTEHKHHWVELPPGIPAFPQAAK